MLVTLRIERLKMDLQARVQTVINSAVLHMEDKAQSLFGEF